MIRRGAVSLWLNGLLFWRHSLTFQLCRATLTDEISWLEGLFGGSFLDVHLMLLLNQKFEKLGPSVFDFELYLRPVNFLIRTQ